MRKRRYTEEQIRLAVQQAEAGVDVTEICRKYGVCQAPFYRWRKQYGALSRSELQELKDLKRENGLNRPGFSRQLLASRNGPSRS